jgi:hypothetical protein
MLIWLQAVVVWGITRLCEAPATFPAPQQNEPGPQTLVGSFVVAGLVGAAAGGVAGAAASANAAIPSPVES